MRRPIFKSPFLRDKDKGAALVTVIVFGTILMILVSTAVAFSLSGVVKSRTDQDWNSAMSAAYAGVEEYESRLANDNTYQLYGDKNAPFSLSSPSLVLPTGTRANPAFGIGASGTWATVPDSGGAAHFRYEVDSSKYGATGVLRLRSTGRVGTAVRTIVANLKQTGFIDFLYFTDYEIQDPAISGDPASCLKHVWESRPSGCSEIAFGSSDVVNGPMHSNDAIRVCDATFMGNVTTSYNPATGLRYFKKDSNGNACSGQDFRVVGSPAYSPVIGMPPTNNQMKKEARTDLASEVPRPGCLYTGPTTIKFNTDGTMTVRSPWTKATQIAGSPATSGTTPAMCGIPGDATGQLGSPAGATLSVPEQNLVFVQNVPSTADPNYWASNTFPAGINCTVSRAGIVTCLGDASTSGAGNGIGFPKTNTAISPARAEESPSATSYGYRNGDVFVEGDMHGALTVAAENYVYVTGDIKYVDPNADILGLVGNNAVWVWNPMTSGNSKVLSDTGRRIDAAILSVAHTFQVQNKGSGGSRGVLNVNGAIAQKFRGIVRSGTNGYTKNYVYDQRLRYIAPPKFLSPVSTSYGVTVLIEVKAAYNADGSVR